MTDTDEREEPALLPPGLSLGGLIERLVEGLKKNRLSKGDMAQLRRYSPPDLPGLAFYKTLALFNLRVSQGQERAWAVLLQALVQLYPLHQPQARLGQALLSTGYSEHRLERLLRLDDQTMFDEVRTLTRFLKNNAEPVNLTELATLVLTRDPAKSDAVRRSLARSYYTPAKEEETPSDA